MKNELLAPNGKPSSLNATQYELVRTPAFKNWFGDWENDPANASKVVDDNGEPLVVYHRAKSKFYEFNQGSGLIGWLGRGFYFSPDKNEFKEYGRSVLACFLNVKKLFAVKGESPSDIITEVKSMDKNNNSGFTDVSITLKENGFNGVLFKHWDRGVIITCFEPNQIKIADGTNNKFDSNNNDIRFNEGGKIDEKDFIVGSKYFYKNQYMDEPINLKLINKQELSNNQIESLTFKKENGTTLTLKKHELEYLFKDKPIIDGYGFVEKLDDFISTKTGYSPEQSFGLVEIIDNKKPNGNFKLNFVEEVKDGRVSKFNISKPLILINKTYSHKGISLKITKIDYINSDQQESESDNKYFNHYYSVDVKLNFDSDIYEEGGITESSTPEYLKMFLGK
jgi:hypothetical protein